MNAQPRSEWISNVGLWRLLCRVPPNDWLIVSWVVFLKILLFIFASKSYQILEDKRMGGFYAWLELWNRWDAPHYLQVARFGYEAADILVYPLLPGLVRFVNYFTDDYFLSGQAVATLAAVAAAVLLYRLVRLDFAEEVSLRAVWFFLIFPTAYFLHAGYTEGLFLALVLGSLLAARSGRWWLAGLLGALCTMTRANGLALLPVLAVEAVHSSRASTLG